LSAGAPPQTPLGELTTLPRSPSWILGAYFQGGGEETRGERREGYWREGRERARKGKGEGDGWGRGKGRVGPKLMLAPQNYFPGAGAENFRSKFDLCP